MAEVKCAACEKMFTCDEVNSRTKQLYKTCHTCRKRNSKTDWKSIVFGKQAANDNTASVGKASSDTESNATEQTISPEVEQVEQVEQEQVEQVTTTHAVEPQMTLNQKISHLLTVFNDTSKDIKNTIDGRDTSTKFVLERIRSDLTNLRMILGNDADQSQFNRYELKLDKLVSRMDNLEQVLHSRFSEIENNLSKKINGIRELI